MSKPFDYSKWDNIELSDDEEDVHPNIDRESWFRMKHRSRVEREETEEKDKKRIQAEMKKANQRIKVLEHDLAKLTEGKLVVQEVSGRDNDDDDDDDDDDDLDDREGLEAEIKELKAANAARQAKLDEYERNKKWNVDNMFVVKEERTIINPTAGERDFTGTGFAKSRDENLGETKVPASDAPKPDKKEDPAKPKSQPKAAQKPKETKSTDKAVPGPVPEPTAMDSYHEFTLKYSDTVEEFMHIQSFEKSKEFLLRHGDVLLQENASNYLLLASLEDEMNGFRDKMRLTARQSQIISNIAELAKSLNSHPGNVVVPFFDKLDQKVFYDGFMSGVENFVEKIIARSVTKKAEMQRERAEREGTGEAVDLAEVPKEERLGPGGLDPLEVIEELPIEMQEAFETRDVERLKDALLKMEPSEAERLMQRCIDSGLWVSGGE